MFTRSVGEGPEVQEEEQSETSFQDIALAERKTPKNCPAEVINQRHRHHSQTQALHSDKGRSTSLPLKFNKSLQVHRSFTTPVWKNKEIEDKRTTAFYIHPSDYPTERICALCQGSTPRQQEAAERSQNQEVISHSTKQQQSNAKTKQKRTNYRFTWQCVPS